MDDELRSVVVMGAPGAVRDAVVARLQAEGRSATVIGLDDDDPLAAALGSRAVLYLPCETLSAPPPSSPERLRNALAAAHAPGVEVLVAVLPLEGFDDELAVLRHDGVPYVVLRAPLLLEELAQPLEGRRLLVVPKGATVRVIEAAALARAALEAIETDAHGSTEQLGEPSQSLADALRRAAALTGRRVRVVELWPWLARAVGWLARLLRRPPLALVAKSPALLPGVASGRVA